MREIGVRELQTTLSQTLRAVARGQQVRVTLRKGRLAMARDRTESPYHA